MQLNTCSDSPCGISGASDAVSSSPSSSRNQSLSSFQPRFSHRSTGMGLSSSSGVSAVGDSADCMVITVLMMIGDTWVKRSNLTPVSQMKRYISILCKQLVLFVSTFASISISCSRFKPIWLKLTDHHFLLCIMYTRQSSWSHLFPRFNSWGHVKNYLQGESIDGDHHSLRGCWGLLSTLEVHLTRLQDCGHVVFPLLSQEGTSHNLK